jgi:hypothetical protein
MSQVLIDVVIEGTTPLLCNRFTTRPSMSATSGNRIAAVGDKGTPMEQAKARLYLGARRQALHPAAQPVPVPHRRRHVLQGRQEQGDDAESHR